MLKEEHQHELAIKRARQFIVKGAGAAVEVVLQSADGGDVRHRRTRVHTNAAKV